MLRYLYAATYSYPKNVEHAFSTPMPAEMLFHLHLYALANTLLVEPLKSLAQKRFQEVVEQDWKTDVFPDTIKRVYEITTPETGGYQLRDIVVRIAAKHGKELMAQGGRFITMMGEVAEFGRDIFQVMTGGVAALSLVAGEMVTYKCPVCPFEFYAKAIKREEIACSSCGVVNEKSDWRAKRKMEVDEGRQNGHPEVNGNGIEYVNGDRVAEVGLVEKNGGSHKKVKEIELDNGTNGTEEKIEWNTMRVNGVCVKESGADEVTHEAEQQKIDSKEKQNRIDIKQNGIDAEQDGSVKKHNGVGNGKNGIEIEDKGTAVNGNGNGDNAQAKTDLSNGNGNGAGAKETGGEVKDTPAQIKKRAKKARKALNAANAASALANAATSPTSPASPASPTSPRATEAQIVGILNGR
jgi:hypothetical protein